MEKTRIVKTFSLLLTGLMISISTCAVFAEPGNLSLAKQQAIAYHDSGQYEKDLASVIKKAQNYINMEVAQAKKTQKLAIVLDIDETSLSNYRHLYERDFANNPQVIHSEILKADAPVIQPMLSLYKDAIKKGVKVFFITGRSDLERQATIQNLQRAGYKGWSGLYLNNDYQSKRSASVFKSKARATIEKQGYTIIASIGDQCSDITGGHNKKGFKLPNPYYYVP